MCVFHTNNDSSSYRVCNGAHPSHSSTLHFCDVAFARYLPEMCAARHDMVQIACGCAAHTVFVLTVAPQMFRCRGGSLSRAHSVGRPPCTPRQCVTTRELFFWMDVIFLQVALGSLPLMLPLRDTSFCGLTQERLGGRLRRNYCASVGGFSRAGGDGGCVAGLSVVWCARSGSERCAVFLVGRCRTARRGLE